MNTELLILFNQSNETFDIPTFRTPHGDPLQGNKMTTTETKDRRKLNSNTGTIQEWLMTIETERYNNR